MKHAVIIHAEQHRQRAIDVIRSLPLEPVHEMVIREQTRDSNDNAALHAMLTDIAKQVKWHGQTLTVEVWKRLCVAAWLREEGGNPLLVPSLDGNGVDIIYERTSTMSHRQIVSLIAWCEAFGTEQGVKFTTNRKD